MKVSVGQIVEFLSGFDGLVKTVCVYSGELGEIVTGVHTDQGARRGDLAWISSEHVNQYPERVSGFRGSLLIGPKWLTTRDIPFIACSKPKLALIRVINRFFSDLACVTWPEPGKQLAPDARIAADFPLSPGVVIGSKVTIGADVTVGPNTVIANCTVKNGVCIGANCSIGLPGFGFEQDEFGKYRRFPHLGGVIIEEDVEIGSNTCIDRGAIGDTVIGRGVKIDNLVHVAHNVIIGPDTLVIANSMLGGSVTIAENVWVAPSVSIMNHATIGTSAVLGLGAVVLKDVERRAVMVGNPARLLRKKDDSDGL